MGSPTDQLKEIVANKLIHSIHDYLAEPDFDLDEGQLQILESKDNQIQIGLFKLDEDTGDLNPKLIIFWTIEVN